MVPNLYTPLSYMVTWKNKGIYLKPFVRCCKLLMEWFDRKSFGQISIKQM
jgi:hypothetical protein